MQKFTLSTHEQELVAHAVVRVVYKDLPSKRIHLENMAGEAPNSKERTLTYLMTAIDFGGLVYNDLLDMGFPIEVVDDALALSMRDDYTFLEHINDLAGVGSAVALRVKLRELQSVEHQTPDQLAAIRWLQAVAGQRELYADKEEADDDGSQE